MGIRITVLDKKDLHLIAPLWEKLNAQHLACSKNFREHFAHQTFEERSAKWRILPQDRLYIAAAQDENGVTVGYCICSTQNGAGELDSIYIMPEFRGQKVGFQLAADGVRWLREKGCHNINVLVAEGNEAVFPFYEKLGFRIRGTVLRMCDDT